MLTRVDHIDIRVPDVEATVAYLKTLGLIEKRRTGEPRLSVEMQLPGENQVVFELRREEEGKTGLQHIAFHIDSPETPEQLKAEGIVFRNQNHFIKDTGRTVSNMVDPNGLTWQLTD